MLLLLLLWLLLILKGLWNGVDRGTVVLRLFSLNENRVKCLEFRVFCVLEFLLSVSYFVCDLYRGDNYGSKRRSIRFLSQEIPRKNPGNLLYLFIVDWGVFKDIY